MTSCRTLILCLADPSGNPRPKRVIELCRTLGHEVHVASLPAKEKLDVAGHYTFRLPSLSFPARVMRKLLGLVYFVFRLEAVRNALNEQRWDFPGVRAQLQGRSFDLLIVEDIYLLSFALSLRGAAKIIFDAREYYPEQVGGNLLWRLAVRPAHLAACRELKLCDAVMTVSPGLAERYAREFGVRCHLVRSLPSYRDMPPAPVLPDRIRMAHHGIANPDRKLENMIEIFKQLDDRFELDFYLQGKPRYIRKLKTLAAPYPKIRFLPPVPFAQIVPMLNGYDIGFYFLQPTGFNTKYALPNKLFEFIQASLLVAIGPSPDMAQIVRHYRCGVVAERFDLASMATLLNALDQPAIAAAKQASHAAAKELCFEEEGKKISALIAGLLGQGAA